MTCSIVYLTVTNTALSVVLVTFLDCFIELSSLLADKRAVSYVYLLLQLITHFGPDPK
jgi:hypothetical protein